MMVKFSIDQKRRELRREIDMRRSVYRREVRDNRMNPQEAKDRIAIMEEILQDLDNWHQPKIV
jgi:hypothetical protein